MQAKYTCHFGGMYPQTENITWLSWKGKRERLESVKHCKQGTSSESSKNSESKSAKTTKSSKARVARASRGSTQQARTITYALARPLRGLAGRLELGASQSHRFLKLFYIFWASKIDPWTIENCHGLVYRKPRLPKKPRACI